MLYHFLCLHTNTIIRSFISARPPWLLHCKVLSVVTPREPGVERTVLLCHLRFGDPTLPCTLNTFYLVPDKQSMSPPCLFTVSTSLSVRHQPIKSSYVQSFYLKSRWDSSNLPISSSHCTRLPIKIFKWDRRYTFCLTSLHFIFVFWSMFRWRHPGSSPLRSNLNCPTWLPYISPLRVPS